MSHSTARSRLPETAQEFLEWPGDGGANRYQLIDGEVRAMSPSTVFHSRIQARLASAIDQRLSALDGGCQVLTEAAVQPRMQSEFNVRVPDLVVTCAALVAGQIVIEDPILLIEILSPSNRAKTWTNVWAYTTIPSVREIVVVHSTRVEVQILRPSTDRIWPDAPETILKGGHLRFTSIGFEGSIETIYAGTPLI